MIESLRIRKSQRNFLTWCTLLFLAFVFLVSTLYDSIYSVARSQTIDYNHKHLISIVNFINNKIADHATRLETISTSSDIITPPDISWVDKSINGVPKNKEKLKRNIFQSLLNERDHFFDVVFLLTPDGNHYIAEPFETQENVTLFNLSHREYFQQAQRSGKTVISNAYSGADGVDAIAIDVPVKSATGDIIYHLGGVIHLESLEYLFIESFDNTLSKFVLIFDGDGRLLTSKGLNGTKQREIITNPIIQESLRKAEGEAIQQLDIPQLGLLHLQRINTGQTIIVGSQIESSIITEYFYDNFISVRAILSLSVFLVVFALFIGSIINLFHRKLKDEQRRIGESFQQIVENIDSAQFSINLKELIKLQGKQNIEGNECEISDIQLSYVNKSGNNFLQRVGFKTFYKGIREFVESHLPGNSSHDKQVNSVKLELELPDKRGFHNRYRVNLFNYKEFIHCSIVDISLLSKAQQALSSEVRSSRIFIILSGIVHDMNNSLGIIKGFSGLLKEDKTLSLSQLEYVDSIFSSSLRNEHLIKRLIGVIRKTKPNKVAFNPAPNIEETVALFRKSCTPDIQINLNIVGALNYIIASQTEFEDALLNILINAKNALGVHGVIMIEVRTIKLTKSQLFGNQLMVEGDYIEIKVIDNGKGILPDDIDKIFLPFYTNSSSDKGTGLGLPQVLAFIENSHGAIDVKSQVDVGTTVMLRFPVAHHKPGQREDFIELRTGYDRTKVTVLIVEDDNRLRSYLFEKLKKVGYQVHAVSNEVYAKNTIYSGIKFDILLTDIDLYGYPGGIDLINELDRDDSQLKIIVLSGATQLMSEYSFPSNVKAKIEKPVDESLLIDTIDKVYCSKCTNEDVLVHRHKLVLTNDLLTHHAQIDQDHRELFELANKFNRLEISETQAKELIDTLISHMERHFIREERLMAQSMFPYIREHTFAHALIMEELQHIQESAKKEKPNMRELISFIDAWLIDHVTTFDKEFANHVNRTNKNEEA